MERACGIITCNYSVTHPSALTANRPPASVPIAGRFRMVDFALSAMVNSGMRNIGLIMPTNYRSLIDHVGSGKDWSLDRKHGGLFLLPGSAFGSQRTGARFLIRDLEQNVQFIERSDKPFVILSSASCIFNIDLVELVDAHIASGADITVVCKKIDHEEPALQALTVDENDRVTSLHMGASYGELASLDLCVMSKETLLQAIAWGRGVDYLDLFEAMAEDLGRIVVRPFVYDGEAMAIFSSDDYYKCSMRLLEPDVVEKIFDPARPIHTKAHDNPPAKFLPGANVNNCLMAGGVRVAGTVQNSILGRDVIVEHGATVRNSVIMQSCVISEGAKVDHAIIDRDNTVAPRVELRGTPENILIKGRGF